jgi:hypothetical protein
VVLALREIKKVSNRKINIDVPDYINTDSVEVILMPYNNPDTKSSKKIDYNKYFGVSNIGTKLIDNYSKEIRNEWDREISY